ncbi:hypothetical protein EBH_0004950 [Eimeria brunetti]|uniref:Uncharacterized protein n=1 Tax=Eimeria brunetti TaxID=51314 RepID=U6LYA1_9EIME|nr:hypothetical protein EBH_0004950 [Eimeria brunetti]
MVNPQPETNDLFSIPRVAVPVAMPQDEYVRLLPYNPVNKVEGQSLGGFQSSPVRKLQTYFRMSQRSAMAGGLVAAACLAVAFVVLLCARNALFPRLHKSPGKRVLADSDLEEEWAGGCSDEMDEGGDEDEAREEGEKQAEGATEEGGEAKALQALALLKELMTLGLQTTACLKTGDRAVLLALLLTISSQELIMYSVHSTDRVEQERQKTLNFIMERGGKALLQLKINYRIYRTLRRGGEMLKLLEQFRTPRRKSSPKELAEEAHISAYRLSHCVKALKQLRPWTRNSTPLPNAVTERFLKVLSYARHAGKSRIRGNTFVCNWVDTVQTQLDFFGILEQPSKRRYMDLPPFREDMRIRMPRFNKRANALALAVEEALKSHPASTSGSMQQGTGSQQQSADELPLSESVLRAEAPVFTPRAGPQAQMTQHASLAAFNPTETWWAASSPPGYAFLWQAAGTPTAQSHSSVGHLPMPSQQQTGYYVTVLPTASPAPASSNIHPQYAPVAPQSLLAPSFPALQPPGPGNGQPFQFPIPVQSATAEIPSVIVTPPGGVAQGSPQIPPQQSVVPVPGGLPAQSNLNFYPSLGTGSVHPPGHQIVGAFQPAQAQPGQIALQQQGVPGWQAIPVSHLLHPPGGSSAAVPVVMLSTPISTGSQEALQLPVVAPPTLVGAAQMVADAGGDSGWEAGGDSGWEAEGDSGQEPGGDSGREAGGDSGQEPGGSGSRQ